MVYVVDTHAIIWFLQGSGLGDRAKNVMRGRGSSFVVPTIALAEIKFLKARGRIRPSLDDVMAALEDDTRFTVYPLDEGVVDRMPMTLNIHDAIICGTALVYRDLLGEEVAVITRDSAIRESDLVKTIW